MVVRSKEFQKSLEERAHRLASDDRFKGLGVVEDDESEVDDTKSTGETCEGTPAVVFG